MRRGSSAPLVLMAVLALALGTSLAIDLVLVTPAAAQQPADPVPPRPAETTPPVIPPSVAAGEKAVKEAEAEAPEDAERAAACKAHALERLKARSPSVADIFIDMDGLSIAKADLAVGGAKVTGVLMGEAYIQRDRSDKAHRFLCLVGEDDTILMTFLTEQ
ncbi:hypothetical protein K9U40_20730 [Xanthobacter autotrophicus]|uniref:hypothetical protein n=1 Tax=Xanthobacter TaxID=279 RepID=UPI0024AB0BB9|nr:hypothetical protein [Xanthobacter autotrophicus]MDI4666726.1 hypothetical protein [Xanthobacter autotrophicus]